MLPEVAKSLKSNKFFTANHTITINTNSGSKTIITEEDLENAIQDEMRSIIHDDSLSNAFNEIDTKFKNIGVREFRELVENNKFIIPELTNLPSFRQKLWVAYLAKAISEYQSFIDIYEKSKKELAEIIAQSKEEKTKWDNVIDIFNKRFSVPFKVGVGNQDDVILKQMTPIFEFKFTDDDGDVPIPEDQLWKVLSNGERRALYLLNIIFEVNARKEEKRKTLFIIDDIADSFDYKNKYAIIEYLNDMAKEDNFYQIILTHNFDFYRTVSGRLQIPRCNRMHVEKSSLETILVQEKYQNNPFDYWKDNLHLNDEMLIASIPFVRNLAEYCGYKNHKDSLTFLLHIKKDTDLITIGDLEKIFQDVLKDKSSLALKNHPKKVKDLIYEVANKICSETTQVIELEKKIVLSIAIRLRLEEFLIKKINDPIFVDNITEYQTAKLIAKYKENFPTEIKHIELSDKVNLMTPENIHINSFMYEPILDMSNQHLKQLFSEVILL